MGELTTIGFSPGQSLLHRLDPRTKQALMMGISVVSVWGGVSFLSILSITLVVLFHATHLKIVRLIREIRYFLFFLLFVLVVRTITLDRSWVPCVSMAAAAEGLLVCWRLLVVVFMGILLMATTRIAHIRAALVWFMTPIPMVDEKMMATMVGLLVRFLPLILFQASEISDAQRARGVERRKNPLVRLIKFSIPLFRRVFLSAEELTLAMQARCYGEARTLPALCFSRFDGWAVGAGVLLCLTVLIP
jgi:energy-coupling factor transporter transmembrane protein EcfT